MEGANGYAAVLSGRPADDLARFVSKISARLRLHDRLHVYDAEPVLYFMLARPAPARYPFPAHHLNAALAHSGGFDPVSEVAGILSSKPQIIIASGDPSDGRYGEASRLLAKEISQNYHLFVETKWRDQTLRAFARSPAPAEDK